MSYLSHVIHPLHHHTLLFPKGMRFAFGKPRSQTPFSPQSPRFISPFSHAITTANSAPSQLHTSLSRWYSPHPKRPSVLKYLQLQSPFMYPSSRLYSISSLANTEAMPMITEPQDLEEVDLFACPVCFKPLIRKGPPGFNLQAIHGSSFKCTKCNKTYESKNTYLDLTVLAGAKVYAEAQPFWTEMFRSPIIPFLYERMWRQAFNFRGFPGPDKEFDMAQEYFKPAQGGTVVDVSCGSGLFSRKFEKSGCYSKVIALDFSENMLLQTYDYIKDDENALSYKNLALVRADVSRLPFSSGSVDAVHAGASLHCWPSPSNAVAEISRILRSGGVFVGTTFLRSTTSTPLILRPFDRRISSGKKNFLTAGEIEEVIRSCGFINYSSKVKHAFIMFSAEKP